MIYVHRTTGTYLGFINDDRLFSRDGVYLAWLEGNIVWDGATGEFKGKLYEIDGHHYILRNKFTVNPIPKVPKIPPLIPAVPPPVANIPSISIKIGYEDSF